jgi:hypothetical protein
MIMSEILVSDNVLQQQKDKLLTAIWEMAENIHKSRDYQEVLTSCEQCLKYEKSNLLMESIEFGLALVKPVWEACGYGYKHEELLALFERAKDPKEDGSW